MGPRLVPLVLFLSLAIPMGCSTPRASGGGGRGSGAWPAPANDYSWDGSWTPSPGELPPAGLFDAIYHDGHLVGSSASPVLPPGIWDWTSDQGAVALLANWYGYQTYVGGFAPLTDANGLQYGWRLVGNDPNAVYMNYRGDPFDGSSGVDLFDLGPEGTITLSGDIGLADGPDMVRYRYCAAADWRTGSSETGALRDDDLVIAGSAAILPAGEYEVRTSTVHTGPGRDLVFMNNIERAAVDLGNGANGRTDTLDPGDGDDLVVIGGNCYDFRVFGGEGNDTFIWRIDETHQNTPWIGANFFGGGGWDPATWDSGTDRIVLDVPLDTVLIDSSTGPIRPGAVGLWLMANYDAAPVIDGPTENDVYARYYWTAGIGPGNKKTIMLEYESASGHVHTGWCTLTGVEEIQIGIGAQAKVFWIDEVNGGAAFDASLEPITEAPARAYYLSIIQHWGNG